MSKHSGSDHRRRAAFHVYAVLCVLTGLSGVALSLWKHPQVQAAYVAQLNQQYQQQALQFTPVSTDTALKKEFRGIEVPDATPKT